MSNYFILKYKDGTKFKGSSIPKSQWTDAPDKKIVEMEYFVGNQKLVLKGYSQYNHLLENVSIIGRGSGIRKVIIMARDKKHSLIIEFDFQNKVVNKRISRIGKEYQTLVLNGWKTGVLTKNPDYKLDKIVGV